MLRIPPILLGLILLVGLSAPATEAQVSILGGANTTTEPAALPEPLTPQAVREMVARMSDDQVRDMLLGRLDAVARAIDTSAHPSTSIVQIARQVWTAFYTPTLQAIRGMPGLVTRQIGVFSTFGTRTGAKGLMSMLGLAGLALAAGLITEQIAHRLTRRWQREETVADDASLWQRWAICCAGSGGKSPGYWCFSLSPARPATCC